MLPVEVYDEFVASREAPLARGYIALPDPYTDPETGVLRNLFGIVDARQLTQLEEACPATTLPAG